MGSIRQFNLAFFRIGFYRDQFHNPYSRPIHPLQFIFAILRSKTSIRTWVEAHHKAGLLPIRRTWSF